MAGAAIIADFVSSFASRSTHARSSGWQERCVDSVEQFVPVERFSDHGQGPDDLRLLQHFRGRHARQQPDGNQAARGRRVFEQDAANFDSAHAGQMHINEGGVDPLPGAQGEARGAVVSDKNIVAASFKEQPQDLPNGGIVINDQNSACHDVSGLHLSMRPSDDLVEQQGRPMHQYIERSFILTLRLP